MGGVVVKVGSVGGCHVYPVAVVYWLVVVLYAGVVAEGDCCCCCLPGRQYDALSSSVSQMLAAL